MRLKNMKFIMIIGAILILLISIIGIYYYNREEKEIKFIDEQSYIELEDYNVYGESINLLINKSYANDISFVNVDDFGDITTITTSEELDMGITPSDILEGNYFIFVDDKMLTSEDVNIDFDTTPKEGTYYNINLAPFYNNAVVLTKESISSSNTCDIMIDPGHGGEDGGAIALDGTTEAYYNLEVSNILSDKLNDLGYSTCLTREDDINPGNIENIGNYGVGSRVGQVYENNAKYVISLHFNTEQGQGYEIYSSVFTTTNFAKSISEKLSTFTNPSQLLMDDVVDSDYAIIQRYHDETSFLTDYMFIIRETAGKAIPSTNEDINNYYDSIYGAETLLIENGYLDSFEDLNNFNDPNYVEQYFSLMADGIDNYIQSK